MARSRASAARKSSCIFFNGLWSNQHKLSIWFGFDSWGLMSFDETRQETFQPPVPRWCVKLLGSDIELPWLHTSHHGYDFLMFTIDSYNSF